MNINIGDKFLCLKDFFMDNVEKKLEYTKGKVYKSENLQCITDNSGTVDHFMNHSEFFTGSNSYFIKIINKQFKTYI